LDQNHKYTHTVTQAAEEKFFGSDAWSEIAPSVSGRLGLAELTRVVGKLIEEVMREQ
jgi:hypothetical protein